MKKDIYDLIIKEKGKSEVSFQKEILTNPKYEDPSSPLVIAVGTAGGKTLMTVIKLDMFYRIQENRGKRVLVCPSSTKILRSNFEEELKSYNPVFSYAICKNRNDFNRAMEEGKEVIICLPQTMNNIKNLPKVEWLVVDEAHKWYFAKVIQKIISRCKPKYQWLLTGTPFKFNLHKLQNPKSFIIHYVPVARMMELGRVGNPLIHVVSTTYDIKKEDYFFNTGEVRSNLKYSYSEDKKSLEKVVNEIIKTLKNPIKKYTPKNILSAFGELDKTIIYCYSKNQASNFKRAFKNAGIEVLSSNSQNDIDSVEFNKFKEYDNYKVLLVVDRGKEGFDMPELFNIIDFTLSTNPEIILQILGRVLRISVFHPNKTKAYYKVSPKNDVGYHYTILGGVLQLIQPGFYQTFTGDIKEIKIPVVPNLPNPPKRKNPKSNSLNVRALQWFEQSGVPLSVNFWKEIKHKMGEDFKTIAWTTLEDVRKSHFGIRKSEWTDDELRQVAARFDNITSMTNDREGNVVLQIINKRDIWEEIAPHIQTEKRKGLSYGQCKKIVLNWKELPSRSKNSSKEDIKVYQRIFDRGWNELLELVPRTKRGKKTKMSNEEVLKKARAKHWIKKGLDIKQVEEKEIEYQQKKGQKYTLNIK